MQQVAGKNCGINEDPEANIAVYSPWGDDISRPREKTSRKFARAGELISPARKKSRTMRKRIERNPARRDKKTITKKKYHDHMRNGVTDKKEFAQMPF